MMRFSSGRTRGALLVLASLLALGGCGTVDERLSSADAKARPARLERAPIRTADFLLVTYARIDRPGEPISIYIEGDGRAWVTPRQLSVNPTPDNPVALDLAARDPAPNVAYIARPCQYLTRAQDPRCEEAYWSQKRFSPEVVRAVAQAVDYYRQKAQARSVDLVGFSGGGTVAVLVAAERDYIESIRTVAGNLDHVTLNSYHKVTQLRGSLNPIDVASRVADIPQIHFIGSEDTVVPTSVPQSFRNASGPTKCIIIQRVDGSSHEAGWAQKWAQLVRLRPQCT